MIKSVLREIKLLQKQRVLHLDFESGEHFELSCLYLRTHSPSADMRDPANVRTIDENINIIGIEPIGHYAIKLIFDDGHDSGIYTWEYLYELACKL